MQIKTKIIEGKNINLREITEDDAEFVVKLRTDPELNPYLATINSDIEKQREYIRKYNEKDNEFYVVIESKQGECYGLGRMYNVTEEGFVPGSWIIKKNSPLNVSMESILLFYEYGFCQLGLKYATIDTKKDNVKGIAFHQRLGGICIGEDDDKVYFRLTKEAFLKIKNKYKKYVHELDKKKVKIKLLEGKSINLREIEEDDAEFAVELRTNPELNAYLSVVDDDVEKQREYIKNYKSKDDDAYFVIENKEGKRYGFIRMYSVTGERFIPGSWVLKKDVPLNAAIESLLLLYGHAFCNLGLKRADIDVRKANEKIIAFHKRFGATFVREDDLNVYMELSFEQFEITRAKYLKYLPASK